MQRRSVLEMAVERYLEAFACALVESEARVLTPPAGPSGCICFGVVNEREGGGMPEDVPGAVVCPPV